MINKSNSLEAIDKTDLSEQKKFRLDEISKIENYFIKEINQRNHAAKLSKYAAVFDYIDQALIVLSATKVVEYWLFHLQLLLVHQLELQVQALLYFFL